MKKKVLCLLLALSLLATPALAYGGGTGEAAYINSTELADGFVYENAVSFNSGSRVETFSLINGRGSDVYPIVMACDTLFGGFTVTQMIDYAEELGYNVVGAVNADFGESTGVPVGLVVEDGVYKSSGDPTSSAIVFEDGRAYISERPEVEIVLTNEETGFEYTVQHFNKSRTDAGPYLFSEYFSTVSTRTSGDGWFICFDVVGGGDVTIGGELELEVDEIITDGGSVPIGADRLVLTASAAAGIDSVLDEFVEGDRVTLRVETSDERLEDAEWVSGCGDVLAEDGEMRDPDGWNSSIARSNPRTALGIKRDGSVVYYVMDGRSSYSSGATLEELAEDMLDMGCVDVVNLDGGGSSVLALRMPGEDGFSIMNRPSDGSLRSVASYILFVTDAEPDGRADRLFLEEDGAYVLAGSSVELNAAALDEALHSAVLPENVGISARRGSVGDGVYTAPDTAGTDEITLSGGGARGSATIHVIDSVDSLVITDAATGGELGLDTLLLENGESIDLNLSAGYLMRDVLLSEDAVTYSVSGDAGEIDANVVFTARADGAGEGVITAECGGMSLEIAVRTAFEFSDMRGHWASESVKLLYELGIVGGVSDTEFGPGLSMRRGDFVLMLYRAAGEPAVSGRAEFSDVPPDAYFAGAVAWAAAEGITQGRGDGSFAPYDTLSRQEGFTFLYRALGALGVQAAAGDASLLDAFPDGDKVSDWARTPTASLIAMGVVSGSGSGLNPYNSLNRAEMAKILALAAA